MLFLMLLPLLLVTYLWKCYKNLTGTRTKKDLSGKHVCITGGSSGIGKAVAIAAAKQGAHVTIIARNQQRLDEALHEIRASIKTDKQTIATVSLDCSNHAEAVSTIESIDDKLPVYMFVNCAGYATCGVFEDMHIDDIKKLFDVNYFATVYPLRAIVPRMKQRNNGVVVITGSQGGLFGIYGYSIYASTKFALRGLAEALRMECRDYNVSVTLSLPPDTDTPGFETENLSKPIETKMISEAGGLVHPDIVAKQLIKDALNGNFFSSVGFESWLMTTLCVGMSPFVNFYEAVLQALLLGPIRLISSYYINSFQKIVTSCKKQRGDKAD